MFLLDANPVKAAGMTFSYWDIIIISMFVILLGWIAYQSYQKGGLIFFFQSKMISVFMLLASGSTLLEMIALTTSAVDRHVPFATALTRFAAICILEVIPAILYMGFLEMTISFMSYRGRIDEDVMKSLGLKPNLQYWQKSLGLILASAFFFLASSSATSAIGALYIETLTGQTITLTQGVNLFYQSLTGASIDASGFDVRIEVGAILVIYNSVFINALLLVVRVIYFELMMSDVERIQEMLDYKEEAFKKAEILKKEPHYAEYLKSVANKKGPEPKKDSGGGPKDKTFPETTPGGDSSPADPEKTAEGPKKTIADRFKEQQQAKKGNDEVKNFESWIANSDSGGTGVQTHAAKERRAQAMIDLMATHKIKPVDMALANKYSTLFTAKNIVAVLGPTTNDESMSFTDFDKIRYSVQFNDTINKETYLKDVQTMLLKKIQKHIEKNG